MSGCAHRCCSAAKGSAKLEIQPHIKDAQIRLWNLRLYRRLLYGGPGRVHRRNAARGIFHQQRQARHPGVRMIIGQNYGLRTILCCPVVIINWVHYLGPPGPFSFPDSRDLLEVLGGLSWQRERGGSLGDPPGPQGILPGVSLSARGSPPRTSRRSRKSGKGKVPEVPREGPENLGRRRVPEVRDTEPS